MDNNRLIQARQMINDVEWIIFKLGDYYCVSKIAGGEIQDIDRGITSLQEAQTLFNKRITE